MVRRTASTDDNGTSEPLTPIGLTTIEGNENIDMGGVSTPAEAPPSLTDSDGKLTSAGRAEANRERIDTSGIRDTNDECSASAKIDGSYSCNGTRTMMDAAKVTNALAQTAGAAAVQFSGAQSMAKSQAEGTQSAMMESAAETQAMGAKIQLASGAVNTAMGIMQFVAGAGHKKDAGKLGGLNAGVSVLNNAAVGGAVQGSQQAADLAIDAGGLILPTDPRFSALPPAARQKAADALNSQRVNNAVGRMGAEAASEQTRMARDANAGGLMSTLTGVQQLTQGGFNLAAANNLKDAAQKLKEAEGNHGSFMKGGPLDLHNGTGTETSGAGGGAGAFKGTSNESSATTAVEDKAKAPDAPSLGQGFDPKAPNSGLNAPGPTAVGTSKGTGGGGGGGGGGGLPSIGGTSAAQAGPDGEPQSQASRADANGDQYSLIGSTPTVGGGGGGVGGSAPPPGVDPAAMLAALLGKKGEDDAQGGKGVLDFGGAAGAGRGTGNENLHDAKTDLFQQIHRTYQDKQRKQAVGR